jgi:AraC-like DNA-binding protein
MAKENNFPVILKENYLTLSEIEESKGNIKRSFEYYKKYINLKDSVYNVDKFGEIIQLQSLYEVSKTNKQIEQLVIDRQINKRTIKLQRVIWLITLIILLLVSATLFIVFVQNRKLNLAYKTLFKKNLEIINLQENPSEKSPKKYKKSSLTNNLYDELCKRILAIMENTSLICDPEFTIDKLAELVQSNYTYVSQVINDTYKYNFRSFLNGYRIREAQRLFSEPDAAKYTIEFVAHHVGFKSRNSFREVFKEITGVSPAFYLKSLQEQQDN